MISTLECSPLFHSLEPSTVFILSVLLLCSIVFCLHSFIHSFILPYSSFLLSVFIFPLLPILQMSLALAPALSLVSFCIAWLRLGILGQVVSLWHLRQWKLDRGLIYSSQKSHVAFKEQYQDITTHLHFNLHPIYLFCFSNVTQIFPKRLFSRFCLIFAFHL